MKTRTLHIVLLLLLALALLLWLPSVGAAPGTAMPVPPRSGHVVDLSGVLNAGQRAVLEQRLAGLEARRGSQLAVLLVPDTGAEPIEQYALRVAEQWKLGRAKVDDGAVLLVATAARTARIEVGYGLEGVLTDAASRRLIDELMVPHFRRGDYFAGLDAGTAQMVALVAGEAPPPPVAPRAASALAPSPLAVLVVALLLARGLRALCGRLASAAIAGSLAGLSVWLLSGVFLVSVAVAAAAFVLALLGVAAPWMLLGGRTHGNGAGGGGRFGGGGASGRW